MSSCVNMIATAVVAVIATAVVAVIATAVAAVIATAVVAMIATAVVHVMIQPKIPALKNNITTKENLPSTACMRCYHRTHSMIKHVKQEVLNMVIQALAVV